MRAPSLVLSFCVLLLASGSAISQDEDSFIPAFVAIEGQPKAAPRGSWHLAITVRPRKSQSPESALGRVGPALALFAQTRGKKAYSANITLTGGTPDIDVAVKALESAILAAVGKEGAQLRSMKITALITTLGSEDSQFFAFDNTSGQLRPNTSLERTREE